jgi:hypothetical protein
MGMRGGRGNISGRCIALQSAESVESGDAVDFPEGDAEGVARGGVNDDDATY